MKQLFKAVTLADLVIIKGMEHKCAEQSFELSFAYFAGCRCDSVARAAATFQLFE